MEGYDVIKSKDIKNIGYLADSLNNMFNIDISQFQKFRIAITSGITGAITVCEDISYINGINSGYAIERLFCNKANNGWGSNIDKTPDSWIAYNRNSIAIKLNETSFVTAIYFFGKRKLN